MSTSQTASLGRPPAPTVRRQVAFLVAACTVLGLLLAAHLRFYHRVEWPLAVWWGLKDWYLWGVLAPAAVWLARRLTPGRLGWPAAVATHVAAAAALVVVHSALSVSVSGAVEGLAGRSWIEAVRSLALKKSLGGLFTYAALVGVTLAFDAWRAAPLDGGGDRDERRPGTGARERHSPGPRPPAPEAPDLGTREPGAPESRAPESRAPESGASGLRPQPSRPAERLLVRRGQQERFVEVARIDRVEAEGNYVRIHAGGETHLERRTLASLERLLDGSRFVRIHRSHVVNLERVDRIEPSPKGGYRVVLGDRTVLPLSRTYRRRLELRIGSSL